MAIVYRHIRLDKNEPFYIGIGKNIKRAYDKRRGEHWKSIVNKSEYRVDILFDNLTWECACLKEIELIYLYGRKDLGLGTLVNKTDGGDGTIAYKPSKESNIKRSNKLKGRIFTEEHKIKISNSLKGHKVSDKSLQKLLERNKKPITDEQRLNMSIAQKKRFSNNSKKCYVKKGYNNKLGNNPNSKRVIDENTGIIYDTIKEASIDLSINYSYLKQMISGIRKNKTKLRYV
jgi:hypothetical protein